MIKAKSTTTPMTQKAASRIQSRTAKDNAGQVSSDSFAARAARTAAQNNESK
jgi:hypothetical protein